jgi:hypothetical protein
VEHRCHDHVHRHDADRQIAATSTQPPLSDTVLLRHAMHGSLKSATRPPPCHAAGPSSVLARGGLFAQAQITGVVDHDFFDWVVEVAGGRQWV